MRDYQALKEKSNHRKSIATESQMNLREYQDKVLQMKKEKELMLAALKEREAELVQLKEIGTERQEVIKELEEKLQQQPVWQQPGKNIHFDTPSGPGISSLRGQSHSYFAKGTCILENVKVCGELLKGHQGQD